MVHFPSHFRVSEFHRIQHRAISAIISFVDMEGFGYSFSGTVTLAGIRRCKWKPASSTPKRRNPRAEIDCAPRHNPRNARKLSFKGRSQCKHNLPFLNPLLHHLIPIPISFVAPTSPSSLLVCAQPCLTIAALSVATVLMWSSFWMTRTN